MGEDWTSLGVLHHNGECPGGSLVATIMDTTCVGVRVVPWGAMGTTCHSKYFLRGRTVVMICYISPLLPLSFTLSHFPFIIHDLPRFNWFGKPPHFRAVQYYLFIYFNYYYYISKTALFLLPTVSTFPHNQSAVYRRAFRETSVSRAVCYYYSCGLVLKLSLSDMWDVCIQKGVKWM